MLSPQPGGVEQCTAAKRTAAGSDERGSVWQWLEGHFLPLEYRGLSPAATGQLRDLGQVTDLLCKGERGS